MEILFQKAVLMDPARVEAINSWSDFITILSVCNFFGLCSYYRIFIFCWNCFTFTCFTKGVTFSLTDTSIIAFRHFKPKMTSDQGHSRFNIDAVLMQNGQIVAYYNRALWPFRRITRFTRNNNRRFILFRTGNTTF